MRRRRNRLQLVLTLILVTLLTVYMMLGLVQKNEVVAHEDVEPPTELEEIVTEELWLRNVGLSHELQEYTWQIAEEYGIAYDLLISIMYHESKFNIKALGKNNNGTTDISLMQINSMNQKWVNQLAGRKLDLWNPKDNILAGALIFNDYRNYWINKGITDQETLFEKTLLSYNRGVNGSNKYIATRGTHRSDYVLKILNYKIKVEMEGGI